MTPARSGRHAPMPRSTHVGSVPLQLPTQRMHCAGATCTSGRPPRRACRWVTTLTVTECL
jgi:hypothetical protein